MHKFNSREHLTKDDKDKEASLLYDEEVRLLLLEKIKDLRDDLEQLDFRIISLEGDIRDPDHILVDINREKREKEMKKLKKFKHLLRLSVGIPSSNPLTLDIDSLKTLIPIEDLYQFDRLRTFVNKSVALCPFHADKSPSFYIYHDSNSYYCFGCGATGDSIEFVKKIFNLSFLDACKFLKDYDYGNR